LAEDVEYDSERCTENGVEEKSSEAVDETGVVDTLVGLKGGKKSAFGEDLPQRSSDHY
uniref:CTNNB1_binding domain-containing protein n=1 Tax=Rodentolepis nana TaxID=102285 RepID=A0A0R3TLI1_RODNA